MSVHAFQLYHDEMSMTKCFFLPKVMGMHDPSREPLDPWESWNMGGGIVAGGNNHVVKPTMRSGTSFLFLMDMWYFGQTFPRRSPRHSSSPSRRRWSRRWPCCRRRPSPRCWTWCTSGCPPGTSGPWGSQRAPPYKRIEYKSDPFGFIHTLVEKME